MSVLLIVLFCWLGWLVLVGILFLLSLAAKRDCLSWAKWISDSVRWILQLGILIAVPVLLFMHVNAVLAVVVLIILLVLNIKIAEPVGNIISAPLWFPMGFLVEKLHDKRIIKRQKSPADSKE
jgi:hypothetical protein